MTKLEIAIKITKGFIAQNWRQSVNEDATACMYRAPNGDKCAAGHLISDDVYSLSFENRLSRDLPCFSHFDAGVRGFIFAAQRCHDDCTSYELKEDWIKFLRDWNYLSDVCKACPELELQ